MSECKIPNERGKVKVWRGFVLGYKTKPSPPKQSVKFKCSKLLRNLPKSVKMRLACD